MTVSTEESMLRSDAGRSPSICEDEEGQRVRRKLQPLSWRQTTSFKVRKSFIIHHLQHFPVQFHRPSEKNSLLVCVGRVSWCRCEVLLMTDNSLHREKLLPPAGFNHPVQTREYPQNKYTTLKYMSGGHYKNWSIKF